MDAPSLSPRDLYDAGRKLAFDLLSLPAADRDRELVAIKQQNPVLYSLVKHQLQELCDAAKRPKPQLPAPEDNLGHGI